MAKKKSSRKTSKKKTQSPRTILTLPEHIALPITPKKRNFFKSFFFQPFTRWQLPLIPIFLVICLLLFLIYFLRDLPSPTNLEKKTYPISTKIMDRNGELLYEIYDDQNRTPIKISDLPPYVREATVAIEDKNFYTHHGFDTGGILRAAWKTLTGQRLEGGSTITQQLVKVALLSPERTLSRKVKEAILTIATEILYTKNQILEMYLNHIPYGGTTYGVEAAAHRFFNKSAKDLSLAEATLLAGLPQAPSRYSPFGNPEAGKARQILVIDRMVEEKFITEVEGTAAKNETLHFASPETNISAPHFVMYVRDLLEDKYGVQTVEQGGLRVTTTLDLDLQNAAQASLSAEVNKIKKLKISNGAALVTNPETGEILAMIGSRNYFDTEIDGKVNVTTRLRQPGSSIKPLNYALGLETKAITPSTMFLDTPICFSVVGQADYCPKNYDNTFHGPVQIRFALGNSLNIPAVKTLAVNGLENFINFARRMGITTWDNPDNYGLSLTLGGGEVTMRDMAGAFGVFANSGTHVPLAAILKVEDSTGKLLYEYKPEDMVSAVESSREVMPSVDNNKALSPQTTFLISHILSDNNARAGAFGTNSVLVIPGKTVSVKTGTTNNLRDNWTIGYTKSRLVAVWVGNNDNTPMSYVASGVTGASPIWSDIMKYSLRGQKSEDIYKPEKGIEGASVCTNSGALPSADLPAQAGNPCETRFEYFIEGTVPTVNNLVKRSIFVNRDTHHPPTSEGEYGNVEEQEHLLGSDPFIKDYCLDCTPYPEGMNESAAIVPFTPLLNHVGGGE